MPRLMSRELAADTIGRKPSSRRLPRAAFNSDPRLRLLDEAAAEYAAFLLDGDGAVADWNAGAQRLFGFPAAEVLGRPVDVLFSPEQRAENLPRLFLDEAALCRSSVTTSWCQRRDGTRFPVRIEFRATRTGTLRGFSCIVRDISDQRELERLRVRANEDKVTGERAALVAEAKNQFVSMISHEIRTPLTGIKGFTEALALENLSPLQRRYVDLTHQSCAALMTVVDDLLDFSRGEAGQIELSEAPFSLAGLAHNALSLVLGVAGPKGLSLSFTMASDVPHALVGDQDRLRQVLLNLLSNAIKFTSQGDIRIAITAHGAENGRELIRVAVSDTGMGIPADRLPRLFNRFSQADASIRNNFGGTGLGLAICKQIVERMGGDIGVDTAPGRGSTFWFTVALPRATMTPAAVASMPTNRASSGDIRVLVVDDGRMNQEIACVFLQHAGYEVTAVDNGTDAVGLLGREIFDIVLMDVQMPGIDGLEATRRIRALGGTFAQLPVIALTARVFPDDIAACLEAGMNGHLAKPFDREEMYRVIAHWTAPAETARI